MPARPFPPPPAAHRLRHRTLILAAAAAASISVLLLIAILLLAFYLYFSLLRRSPTLPFDSTSSPAATPAPLRRFSHRQLRSATNGFDAALSLGRGASASVFHGILPDGKSVAVKRLRPPSATSDREFQNELRVLAPLPRSPAVVALLGYCLEGRRRRLLVYEYMPNGSLQEALFGPRSADLCWNRRFQIILDVAAALAFLHLECDPPVIHGDVKPSNVLLDADFRAKVSDFGLSRTKSDDAGLSPPDIFSQELGPSGELGISGSPYKNTGTQHGDELFGVDDNSKDLISGHSTPFQECRTDSKRQWGKDWWWKQEGSGELCSKDYVTEWIGSLIIPSSNPDWADDESKSPRLASSSRADNADGKKKKKKMENNPVTESVDGGEKKNKEMREWWKEEYFAEMKNKGEKGIKGPKWFHMHPNANRRNLDVSFRKGWKKKRNQSAGTELWSGDLFSRELSSTTTSMRGTVCYVAPEFGGCGHLMEKLDVYSFGVLILVIVSGRRPLHVLSSPMKLEKANLISWCRQLVQAGSVLELVDERLKDAYNMEQVSLCINLAIRCLQKSPELRPDSGDIVKILKGEMDLAALPYEYSPSPPMKHLSKSRRKITLDTEKERCKIGEMDTSVKV